MQLFGHQKTGVAFLTERRKAILGDEPGLGKTTQSIHAAGTISEGDNLIVCPANVKQNWEREIHMVYPEDRVYVFGLDEGEIPSDTAWFVINYDILEKYMSMLQARHFQTVILDESHYIKGSSIRTKQSLKLCKTAKQVFLLSGTVIQNRPVELWNQLVAIAHPLTQPLSESDSPWIRYIRRYCDAFQMTNPHTGRLFWNPNGASNLEELHLRLRDYYLRRKKKDVTDMPEKMRTVTPVKINDEWMAKYETAFDEYIKFLTEHPIEDLPDVDDEEDRMEKIRNVLMVQHLVELGKVKQVASLARSAIVVEKIKELVDNGEKVVVFTGYKNTLSALKKGLGKIKSVELTGDTKTEDRQAVVDQFQNDDKTMVFLGNIRAAGVGITLTKASNVVFADLDWNPANHDQAEDRCHRIGQKETVNAYYFISTGTIEEDIMDMLDKKRKVIEAVMEGQNIKGAGRNVATQLIKKLSTQKR